MPRRKSLEEPDYDWRTEWRCCWRYESGDLCPRRGQLAERLAAFMRHLCRGGHGTLARLPDDEPAYVYDVCATHVLDFQRAHALDAEPLWLRRVGLERRDARPLAPAAEGPRVVVASG